MGGVSVTTASCMVSTLVSVTAGFALSVTLMVSVTEVAVVMEGTTIMGVSVSPSVMVTVPAGTCVHSIVRVSSASSMSVAVAPVRV